MRVLHAVLAVGLAASACSKSRPLQGDPVNPVSWEEEIAPLFAAKCNSCHSGPTAAAGYRTTSYNEALGPPSAQVASAGAADSLLLKTINPSTADAVHQPVSGTYETARSWVVDGNVSFFRSGIHTGGILNPRDPQFHKNLIANAGWNFSTCQGCHGDDLQGGKAGVSCQQCHALLVPAGGTPTCTSCHGSGRSPAPPRDLSGNLNPSAPGVGAHEAHLFGRTNISSAIKCEQCHIVPTAVQEKGGHLDHPPYGLRPAVITFSDLAVKDGAAPAWNATTLSCSATYCHGGGAKLSVDTAARQHNPVWNLGTSQAFCGACHGLPPQDGTHPAATFPNCSGCHPQTVDPFGNIIVSGTGSTRTSTHINGVIDVTP